MNYSSFFNAVEKVRQPNIQLAMLPRGDGTFRRSRFAASPFAMGTFRRGRFAAI
jgi:hypothetical protein